MPVTIRRGRGRLAALCLLILALGLSDVRVAFDGAAARPSGGVARAARAQSAASSSPNIIFLLTDDLDAASIASMPNLQALLVEQGASFSQFFDTVSLCCPSRAATLRGQYAHNTQILSNRPPLGGFERFYELGHENSTVATWLQGAGYRTALLGKYLNGYPQEGAPDYVPPGWDEWASPVAGNPYGNYNYTLNENGALVAYGDSPADYLTDVLAAKATSFITTPDGRPFFLYLATYAPHGPATPAPRHQDTFPGATAPRTVSFDEEDVSDKPAWVRGQPALNRLGIRQIDTLYRKRLQSLLAVDEMIGALVETLRASGQLDNTYLFFTSDNGFHLGQHRLLPGKQTAYEEDIRVPLLVRGPGVPAGRTLDHLAGNTDLAPTFAALAGAPAPDFIDGRSLAPLLGADPPPPAAWRQAYLVEHTLPVRERERRPRSGGDRDGTREPPDLFELAQPGRDKLQIPTYAALRTVDYLYVEYATGERELYDLLADPNQLHNLAATADPALLGELSPRLAELRGCAGAACRAAEEPPPAPQPGSSTPPAIAIAGGGPGTAWDAPRPAPR